jgi:hypothetical protein
MKKLLLSVLMVFTFSALTFAQTGKKKVKGAQAAENAKVEEMQKKKLAADKAKNEAAKSADAIDESRLSTSSEAAKLKATKQ